MISFESYKEEDTFNIGRDIALKVKQGDIVCLDGDLGVGKTVFTKGFAVGLDIDDCITSPTFTIVQEYHEGRLPLFHFDVYRIADPEEMYEIGFEEYINGDGVCLIEWATMIEDILPRDIIKVTISKDLDKGIDYRLITVEGYDL